MALIRIALGCVVLWDLFWIAGLDLVVPLLAPEEAGGLSTAMHRPRTPPWHSWLPPTVGTGWALWVGLFGSVLAWTCGVFTRTSMLIFVLLSAQFNWILPNADRGIDTLIRNVVLILACSQCGSWASIDARIRTGSWWGSARDVPAWPRHLIVLQLVLMYFMAGVQKFGLTWSPFGGYSALYLILQDPAIARVHWEGLAEVPWFTLTQIGTAGTILWEWSTPVLLVVFWYRHTADRPGRLRGWFNRRRVHWWWATVGIVFHLGIAVTMELGIFSWAMVALYGSLVHPREWPSRSPP